MDRGALYMVCMFYPNGSSPKGTIHLHKLWMLASFLQCLKVIHLAGIAKSNKNTAVMIVSQRYKGLKSISTLLWNWYCLTARTNYFALRNLFTDILVVWADDI